MKFDNIIFDFDGTLIDSRPGVVKSFKRAVKDLTSKQINEGSIIKLIGKPLAQIISVLLKTSDQALIDKGSDLFRKYYRDDGLDKNIIYSGVKEMLKSFKEKSLGLFVVSNKIEEFMIKILEQHDIKKYFISATGIDGTDPYSKKADYVKSILTNFKLKKGETAIVGDTESDIIAGKANSIYCIGVTWGYGLESNLIKSGADKICRTPLGLERFIKK